MLAIHFKACVNCVTDLALSFGGLDLKKIGATADQDIAAIPPTFLTSHARHFELANEIAEYDCPVAGHL